jgi:hypothetical protein
MSLETYTGKVSDLVVTNPTGSDPRSQGDDHLRGIKLTIVGQSQQCQIGQNATPANNFTLDATANNGTMKLARGNAGATTQDILSVDSSGNLIAAQQVRGITPVAVNDLTRKDYVDGIAAGLLTQAAADARYVNVDGDTMTGGLKVGGGGLTFPDNSLQASAASSGAASDRGSGQLPGGVRIQYGTAVITFNASGDGYLPYNSPFPNTAWLLSALSGDAGAAQSVTFSILSSNTSGASLRAIQVNPYGTVQGAVRVNWVAMGS